MNNKNIKIVAVLFVIILVFTVLIKKTPSKKQIVEAPPQMISSPEPNNNELELHPTPDLTEKTPLKVTAETTADHISKTNELDVEIKKSNIVLEDFKKDSRLKIPNEFSQYTFHKINNVGDPNTIGITGHNQTDGTDLSILSRQGSIDILSVKKYIQDDVADELKMSITENDLKVAEAFTPPQGSGFSSIQVWIVKEKDKIAVFSLSEKTDKSGSVLTIFSGPATHIERNEARYEELILALGAH